MPGEDAIRLALVAPTGRVGAHLRRVVESDPGMTIVAEAVDGDGAVLAAERHRPDVVVVALDLLDRPGSSGLPVIRRIVEGPGAPAVMLLTSADLDGRVIAALEAGASAFLPVDADATEVLASLKAVHRGEGVGAPSTTRLLVETIAPAGPRSDDRSSTLLAGLTGREREVLHAVGRGMTNAEIADSLHLAEATVKTHVGHILAKLALRDRVQMVVFAYESGLVRPGRGPS